VGSTPTGSTKYKMQKVIWDAAVVLLQRRDGKVLGVTRGNKQDDINLPGGRREPQDRTPFDTAKRELLEETGIRLFEVCPIVNWVKNGKRIIVFEVFSWDGWLRPSAEGTPIWTHPINLLRRSCTYSEYARRLLGG
jgi:8-oxo-dGTP pyrophosphatase MutT (NUDIX family)